MTQRPPSVPFGPAAASAVFLVLVLLASCGGDASPAVELTTREHRAGECSGRFVAHDLDHVTSGPGDTASTFDGTGAGIAAGDLDDDGDLDLVVPNLSDSTSVFENVGDLRFERHELIVGRFRGAAAVDLDADGDLDIVLSTGIGPPVPFTNQGDLRFERGRLDGVRAATYSFAFGDLSGDGDLDLVTGSYNAELTILRNSPVLGSDTGVVLHERNDTGYAVTRLSPDAQALALLIADIDGDGPLDILVGNDLATPDMVFVEADDGWQRIEPFSTTTYSTMSYDAADLDGDGQVELFATDMAPMADANLDDYREVFADLEAAPKPDDVQVPENVLLESDEQGWSNSGRGLGVEATGWSWSGLFGDLDHDGRQDIYVVNGMRSDQLFDFLPDARLVEANQVFRNAGDAMVPMPDWDLADTAGGRGAVVVDLDGDGDLDIAVNNLDEPTRVFENQLCGGAAVTVELAWPGTGNTKALGATVSVRVDSARQNRTVTSSRGYLSATAPVVHFGTVDADLVDIDVRWPDGASSTIDDVAAGTHLMITRTD